MDTVESPSSHPPGGQALDEIEETHATLFLHITSAWKISLSIVLSFAIFLFVRGTWHWPLVGDAPLIHYVVFLAQHGRVPYRQIFDPNMPGAYFVEWSVIHLFGPGALAWRLFDFGLLAAVAACSFALCRPHDWFAGIFAAGIFALIHDRDGLTELGQRDLVMSVLLLAACVCLFSMLRRQGSRARPIALSLASGFFLGFAASIKPTALFFAVPFLILSAVALVRRHRPAVAPILAAVAGCAIPAIAILLYLIRVHALRAFVHTVFRLAPYHSELWKEPWSWLTLHVVSSVMLPLFLLWLPVAAQQKRWKTFEGAILYCGVAAGALSFIVQSKGFSYHRYPSEAFLLLLIGLDCAAALRRSSPGIRILSFAALGVGVLVVGAGSARQALRYDWRDRQYDTMLQADLRRLGGTQLSGDVQCLDMASGCLDTLLEMQLVQSTGTLYDCYMFWPEPGREEDRAKQQFWTAISAHAPRVFIVNNRSCAPTGYNDGPYGKLSRWPQFAAFLSAQYTLYADRAATHPPLWNRDPGPTPGYRIYLRKPQTREADRSDPATVQSSGFAAPPGS